LNIFLNAIILILTAWKRGRFWKWGFLQHSKMVQKFEKIAEKKEKNGLLKEICCTIYPKEIFK
jgi:hypothetical protein